MKISIGFSPCPNDTFIFDALVNNKINTQGISFDVLLDDVETLNNWALQEKLMLTKISYGVLPLLTNTYQLLPSGGALGYGVGPLLITKPSFFTQNKDINTAKIGIPGINTTAHILLSTAYPTITNKKFLVFNEIEDALLQNDIDAGVIIHENRFTYAQKGLVLIQDLGNIWEQKTHQPIPLGAIVAHKNVPIETAKHINKLIQQSIQYAQHNYPHISQYVQSHAQAMETAVMLKHIDLYVNKFSNHIGNDGKMAIQHFLNIYANTHQIQAPLLQDILIDA